MELHHRPTPDISDDRFKRYPARGDVLAGVFADLVKRQSGIGTGQIPTNTGNSNGLGEVVSGSMREGH